MSWPAALDRRGFAALLVAAWALAYLPHLGTRPLRLEEGRRATPAREMLATGDFVRPTLYGHTYLSKPPLYFWLVAATAEALGEVTPLATRLPSVLAALGCALVALRFAPDVLDRRTRALAALFVLSSSTLLDKGTLGEIDPTLCLLVALALKCWWDGNGPDRQTPGSWMAVGLLLGMAGLLKGPAGPALFYMTVGPYLAWQRRLGRLFTAGHAACLALAVLPAAAWVACLLERGVISGPHLLATWAHQLGARGSVGVPEDPDAHAHAVAHYVGFLPLLAGMFFPAVVWLPFALRPKWSEARGLPEDLRRFLVCGVLGPAAAFYLYPEARPRHMMPSVFPAAVLAAMAVSGLTRRPGAWSGLARRGGMLLALAPAVLGVLAVGLAVGVYPAGVWLAGVALAVGAGWSWRAFRLARDTSVEGGTISLAVGLSGMAVAAWFAVNLVVVPWQAPTAVTQTAIAVAERLPPGEPVYTTRRFPETGEGYYNLQFHLARDVRGTDLDGVRRAAPCLAVVTPEERAELEAGGWAVAELGRIGGRGVREVWVVRVGCPVGKTP